MKRRRRTKRKFSSSTLFQNNSVDDSSLASSLENRQEKGSYLNETLRPIVCLVFVLPLLLVYELGSIFTDQMSGKSGIDAWLHYFMDNAGIGHLVVLPMITTGILLHWHHQLKDRWKIKPRVLIGMTFESAVLGIILFFAGNAFGQMIASSTDELTLAINSDQCVSWNATLTYIGCGVYEELVFRLMLLSGLIYLGKDILRGVELRTIAIVATSIIFALLHYDIVNPAGAPFDTYGFLFRFSASIVFCLLFLLRGFGIAVGTHVIYDVMTQI